VSQLVVIKVGGSLLDWEPLPERLTAYLEQRCGAGRRLAVIVGGGRMAEGIRDLDRLHHLGALRAHELAVRALDLTAHVLAALVPGLEVVGDLAALCAVWSGVRIPVLLPGLFLAQADRRAAAPLPSSWDVTTDAIAARIATDLGASELALLKSAPLPPGTDRAAAARLGLVDRAFPMAACSLPSVTYRNLRDPNATAAPL
jgi:aspartokinase-like uncharacterized kinase